MMREEPEPEDEAFDALGEDEWLPVMEAARLIGKSPWTLYTLARKGRIETCRIDHRILVNLGSLSDYFRQRE